MADVTINASVDVSTESILERCGIYWTSSTTGYLIYIDTNDDLVYDKTTDTGATWAGVTVILAGTMAAIGCWADWQTTGDSGTVIHIVVIDRNTDDITYAYLDTSNDSTGTDVIEACQGTGTLRAISGRVYHMCSITKSRGGNICVAAYYQDDTPAEKNCFYTSPDGDTWTSGAAVWEDNYDQCLLFPANLADDDDIWALYWDNSSDEISLKTYDDDGDSWGEASVSGSMDTGQSYPIQMTGIIRHSDGHLLVAAWSEKDTATADLKTWDITDAGTITAKTNIITDEAESALASMFIDQNNDYVYVAYVSGTAFQSQVQVFYQYSDDDMATWEGETAMQADAEEDIRWISCGCHASDGNGNFMPVWFDDDDTDLFCSTDNAVAIAAAGGLSIPVAMHHYTKNVRAG